MFIDLLKEINEGRAESGRGSKKGREKYTSQSSKKGSVQAKKSRVRVFDTIDAALNSGAPYGTIFSTKGADRLYVISKPDWGKKSTAGGNTKIAKGFTPGSSTPGSSWPSIKAHSVRTAMKHGVKKSKTLSKKYGPGRERDEGKTKATVGESTQIISEWDLFVEKVAFLKEQLEGVGKGPEAGTEPKKEVLKKGWATRLKAKAGDLSKRAETAVGSKLSGIGSKAQAGVDKATDVVKKVPGVQKGLDVLGKGKDFLAKRRAKKDWEALDRATDPDRTYTTDPGTGLVRRGGAATLAGVKKAAPVVGAGLLGTAKGAVKGTKLAAKGAVKTTGLAAKGALKTTAAATKVAATGVTTASNLAGSAGRKALRTKIHGT